MTRDAIELAHASFEAGGMRVQQERLTAELYEAAFIMARPINALRGLMRRYDRDDDDPNGLPYEQLSGGRRTIALTTLRDHPFVRCDPLALLFLVQLAEGTLHITRVASDRAEPEDHIVALKKLFEGLRGWPSGN